MSAQSYELRTFGDIAALYRKLPVERGELLLREICEGVRCLAPIAGIVEAAGGELSDLGPLTWTDDDKGGKTVRLFTEEDGEPALTFNFRPAQDGETPRDLQTVEFSGQTYRKFIFPGEPVDDGTVRCVFCGQIDEDEAHDAALCPSLTATPSPTGAPE